MNSLAVSWRDPILNSFKLALAIPLALGIAGLAAEAHFLPKKTPPVHPPNIPGLNFVRDKLPGASPSTVTLDDMKEDKKATVSGARVNSVIDRIREDLGIAQNYPGQPKVKIPHDKRPLQYKALPNGKSGSVVAPAAIGRVTGKRAPPKMKQSKDGVTVSHSELLTTVVSSSVANTFYVDSFVINPGKANVFPWLSTIAVNYDKYRISKMAVELVTFAPTSTAGRIGIAYDPDSTDEPPANKTEFFAMEKHIQGPVWQSVMLELPVPTKELFVNSHTTADSKLIDAGQFVVMSDNLSSTSTSLADVIVHYTVELRKPQQALYSTQYWRDVNPAYYVNKLVEFQTVRGPNISPVWWDGTNVFFLPPSGTYLLTYMVTDAAAGSPNFRFTNNTVSKCYYRNTGNTTSHHGIVIFNVTATPNVGADGFSGEHIKGLYNLPTTSLENIQHSVTRISPTIFKNLVTSAGGGYTELAVGGTSVA